MRAAFLAAVLVAFMVSTAGAEDARHRELAAHYAPVVFQESRSTVLDYITRFDYDGDWRGDNNWRNAYLYDLPGYVYYGVIESTNHYFITYAFYHARDYSATPYEGFAPKTEHENDMEGMTVTVEKDGTSFGKVVLLETLAHDVFYKYSNRDNPKVTGGASRLDGAITFVDDRPAVFIEAEGHGVRAASATVTTAGDAFQGIVYRYAGKGAVPQSNRDPNATYDLLDIEDTLWAHRFDVGSTYCCADAYAMRGGTTTNMGSAFNGPIGGCAAKPPWGWDQGNDAIAKGDWFRDPLRAYRTQVSIQNFAGSYVYNPYVVADGRAAAPLCSQTAASKTVKGALTASLLGIGEALTANGVSRGSIGGQARQLFLSNTALLEWARKGDFEQWTWDKTLAALPSLITEGLRDEMLIPKAAGFSFVSPSFNAAARYFDRLVLRYSTSLDGLRARVLWTYDANAEFSDELSLAVPLDRTDAIRAVEIPLSQSPTWDRNKSVLRIKVSIESPAGTVAEAVPGASASTDQFRIAAVVLDRASFSDTFER